MKITQQNLQKGLEIQKELNIIKESIKKELEPYLCQMCWHNADINNIILGDNSVSFEYTYWAYGAATDWGDVTWDYFDDPKEYIEKEKIKKKEEQEREKIEDTEKELKKKRETFEKLKKEFNE